MARVCINGEHVWLEPSADVPRIKPMEITTEKLAALCARSVKAEEIHWAPF